MTRFRIPYFGHFQNDTYFRSENPLAEVWERIGRFSSQEILRKELLFEKHPDLQDALIDYISTRINQAIEFENASKQQSLLTKPLLLYYAMLNLMRAKIAIGEEVVSGKAHGLIFHPEKNILDTHVTISPGTFKQYLDSKQVIYEKDKLITFRDALGNIIEMGLDLKNARDINMGFTPFLINAFEGGDIEAHPLADQIMFKDNWKIEFPNLVSSFIYKDERLELHDDKYSDINSVQLFINNVFLTNLTKLTFDQSCVWYLYKQNRGVVLPRIAYYHIAFFILSNYVRYEPEQIQKLIKDRTELFWLISRLQYFGDRYYPQLIINDIYNTSVYF